MQRFKDVGEDIEKMAKLLIESKLQYSSKKNNGEPDEEMNEEEENAAK